VYFFYFARYFVETANYNIVMMHAMVD
jgi:hypothetical protein